MIHQILQALTVTEVTGMHLQAVFPIPIQLTLMMYLAMLQWLTAMMKPKSVLVKQKVNAKLYKNEGLRALKITQYYDTHGSDDELQFNLFSVEEGMYR